MKKLFIIFLLIPTLIVAQDAKKQKENKPKATAKHRQSIRKKDLILSI